MNSLDIYRTYSKKAIIALTLISVLAIAAAAQVVAPQDQGKMYGDPGFVGEAVNLNVVNADIRDILRYITEQYGINFVIDKSVKAVPVTVNVSNVPWNIALDSILQSQDLAVQVNGPILRVADSKKLAEEQEIIRKNREGQIDVAPLYTEFIRLNYARAYGTLQGAAGGAGQTTTGVGGGGGNIGGGGGAGMGGAFGADQGILGIVKKRLSRRGGVEVDGRSNTLIVTDVRENIDAIRQLVYLLDQPEPQVEIETRIVVASRNFSRDLGVQLNAIITGDRGRQATVDTFNRANNFNTIIGLTTGVFGTAQIDALITAGESKGQAKTIATPRVTTLNNRPAEIQSGTQIPISTVQPGSGGTEESLVLTTEYVSVPLRLAVTPQITDVGTVILNVVAENSNVSGNVNGGGAPPISTQSMQTQVMVPDGGTTVIGGVLIDREEEQQDRTPGLSRIPIIKYLFKRKGVTRTTDELLFFITPRIYRPDYDGRPGPGKVSDGPRSTTILQPVPLGNPPSNSGERPVPVPSPVTGTPVAPSTPPANQPGDNK